MREPQTFRRKPIEIQAMQWTGDNADELAGWTNGDFHVIDEEDRPHCDDPESTGSLLCGVNSVWFEMATGDWVCLLNGYFFWIGGEPFRRDYEEAGE